MTVLEAKRISASSPWSSWRNMNTTIIWEGGWIERVVSDISTCFLAKMAILCRKVGMRMHSPNRDADCWRNHHHDENYQQLRTFPLPGHENFESAILQKNWHRNTEPDTKKWCKEQALCKAHTYNKQRVSTAWFCCFPTQPVSFNVRAKRRLICR